MDGVSGQNSVPPASSFDKSRVLDVKPLRTLVPVFPNPPQAPPFVCSSPFGPFPSGFSPFYPFSVPQGAQTSSKPEEHQDAAPLRTENQVGGDATPAAAVPLRSFGTPLMGTGRHFSGMSNGDTDSSLGLGGDGVDRRSRRTAPAYGGSNSSQKKPRRNQDSSADGAKKSFVDSALSLSPALRDDGDRDSVTYVMMIFDALRRRISQLEDAKESTSGIIKRADLKAGSTVFLRGIRTNARKRIGAVPGIEIGDIFFFRMEMCIVGLHAPSMAGIDYMTVRNETGEETLAVSIVSSGGYDDDAEDKDVLIYTGQGGNLGGGSTTRKDKQVSDQKLVRGNLALDRSSRQANEIRVIRGVKDITNPLTKVYVYDGLYTIQEGWVEKSKSGANSFKYKLVRVPGQPPGFSLWQSVQSWKAGNTSRTGLILPDLTAGVESVPVSLVNDVDGEKGPSNFTYFPSVRYTKAFNLTLPSSGCDCRKECSASDLKCSCIRRNGGDFPYTQNGILVSQKPLVYECGISCPCFPNCKNRVSQAGVKLRLEVFKTQDRGWGLRSWDPIRAGTFICEYAGEVIEKSKFDAEGGEYNEYVFDTVRAFDSSFKWNYYPELLNEDNPKDPDEARDIPSPLLINAKDIGNVARFINHSCSPNILWQPIAYDHNPESYIHIGFFAMQHIPPMTELTYDYGLSESQHRRKQCLCRSLKCKGYFG